MNLLFLAPATARNGHRVVALTMQQEQVMSWRGMEVVPCTSARSNSAAIHPWVADFEAKTIRAEACFRAALALRQQGFVPDAIGAHPGWGESLFLKEVWPSARLGVYAEFFYHPQGADAAISPTQWQAISFPEPFRSRITVVHDGIDTQPLREAIAHDETGRLVVSAPPVGVGPGMGWSVELTGFSLADRRFGGAQSF